MNDAYAQYALSQENDFQRQFVEEAEPVIMRIFEQLTADAASAASRDTADPPLFNRTE
jgi:hypothetical protein